MEQYHKYFRKREETKLIARKSGELLKVVCGKSPEREERRGFSKSERRAFFEGFEGLGFEGLGFEGLGFEPFERW